MDIEDFIGCESKSENAVYAAIADNLRFDERCSEARMSKFYQSLSAVGVNPENIDWASVGEANRLFADRYCDVPNGVVPDAFLDDNQPAWLSGDLGNQSVVRLESLTTALKINSNMTFGDLKDLMQRSKVESNPDAVRAMQAFMDTWNNKRDARPAFAAFHDEVKEECDLEDWPNALRDRLGLGHYSLLAGSPIPVALMKYSLSTVLAPVKSGALEICCSLPTVLDGGLHEYFFPVPRESVYGSTLHLAKGKSDQLTAEIIHFRVKYETEHVWKIGWLDSPRSMTDSDLRESRDLHLLSLQISTDRDNFGEFMAGRPA